MKRLIPFILLVLTVACTQKKAEKLKNLPFPHIEVPSMISSSDEAMVYFAQHFWDKFTDTSIAFNLCDTQYVNGVSKEAIEPALAGYIGILDQVSLNDARKGISLLFYRAEACEAKDTSSNIFEYFTQNIEKYLYDPNSPYRNEDYYQPFAKLLSQSRFISVERRAGYLRDAELCSLNSRGTPAADFAFSYFSGKTSSLYSIKADYTVLFFSNPGCTACKTIIDALKSPEIDGFIRSGKVAVANIYIDEDLQEWMKYRKDYPEYWHSGYDHNLIIRSDNLYSVRAIPSLYLLDKEKRVILKDAPENRLLDSLLGHLK